MLRWFSRKHSKRMTSNLLKRSARGCACKHGFSGAAMAQLKFLKHRGAGFGLASILLHARCPLAVERLAVTQSQTITPSSCLLGLSLCLLLGSFAIDALDLSSRSRHAAGGRDSAKFSASSARGRENFADQNNAFLHGAAIEWTEVWPTQLLYTGREAVNRQKVASQ